MDYREITRIARIYADSEEFNNQTVTVAGWAKTIRDMKNFGFLELNDGSCFRNLQVVLDAGTLENYPEIASQNVGAAMIVTGVIALTPDAKQPLELKASKIMIEGASTPDYPLQKKRHSKFVFSRVPRAERGGLRDSSVFSGTRVCLYSYADYHGQRRRGRRRNVPGHDAGFESTAAPAERQY